MGLVSSQLAPSVPRPPGASPHHSGTLVLQREKRTAAPAQELLKKLSLCADAAGGFIFFTPHRRRCFLNLWLLYISARFPRIPR